MDRKHAAWLRRQAAKAAARATETAGRNRGKAIAHAQKLRRARAANPQEDQ